MTGVYINKIKQCAVSIIFVLVGVFLTLSVSQTVKADDTDITSASDIQGLLNQNNSVIQNYASTQTSTINNIAPLSATTTESGTFGTCDWDIDDNGLLTIHAGVLGNGIGNWVADGKMNDTIKNVVCDPGVVANQLSNNLFNGLKSVESIDVSNLDTSNVTNMTGIFSAVYVTGVSNNVNKNTTLVKIIGLENLNTEKVNTMNSMFDGDTKLNSLNVSNFNTSNVTDMSRMFNDDTNLTEINGLNDFDTSNVTYFSNMFSNLLAMEQLNGIENWNISKAISLSSMFSNMRILKHLDLSKWDTSNVETMSSMFYFCQRLTGIDGLKNWNTSNVTDLSQFLYGNVYNDNIHDIEGWDTSKVTKMNGLFQYCMNLEYVDLTKWDTSKVTDMNNMFSYTSKLTKIEGIKELDTHNVTNMSGMFQNTVMDTIDLSGFDTSNVTNMNSMFQNSMAKNIIGTFDTSKVTTIASMFSDTVIDNFDNISLNISNWNLSNCQNFSSAFQNNKNIESIDLSNWKTLKVTNLLNLFLGDNKLKYINLSGWDTSHVTNMGNTFGTLTNLCELDLSSWDTSKVTKMGGMFTQSQKLWKLTLGPKTKFITSGDNGTYTSLPTPPANNTEIDDPNTDESYYSISDKWQEVDYDNGGTDHDPAGKLYSSLEMNEAQRTDNTTYVWQQQPYMDVSMEVPNLTYGRAASNQGITEREQNDWAITLNNNVYPVMDLNTTISVNMEHTLDNANGDTLNDSFIFRDNSNNDTVISTSPTIIFNGKLSNGTSNLSWDNKHGFLMNLHSFNTPMGKYTTTLDWTMVNSV